MNTFPERGPAAELRLRRLLQRYEALSEAPGVIVWVIDAQLQPVAPNDAWERYTGLSHSQYDRRGWMDVIHPSDRARLDREVESAFATGRSFITELRIRRADGAFRRNIVRAVPVMDEGEIVEWIGTATDVEDARQAADELAAIEAEGRDLRARLLALTDGAESLLATRDEGLARTGVLDLARRVLPADGYAIWWHDASKGVWRIVQSAGLSPAFATQELPGEPLLSVQPLVKDDVFADPALGWRQESYEAEGIASLLTIPLPIRGERRATLVTYHRTPHTTSETELRVAIALGQVAAAALGNAEFNAAQDRAQARAQRQTVRMAYLAEASAVLGSLEYETTLQQIARMAVPTITDWCAVDLIDETGALQRIVTAHVDPEQVALAHELEARYPADPASPSGAPNVLRTGQPEFYPQLTDDLLAASARDPAHLRLLQSLRARSVLLAPLAARGRTLGVMTFVNGADERPLLPDDVTVLTEVARRAGLAVDNARLFRHAETANRLKDEFLAVLSHELRTPLNAIMGWTHMLRQGLPPESQVHAFNVISRNAQSQKQLVEDLLDVARIAAGRIDLEKQPVDLRHTARTAVDSALPAAREKGITIRLACADDPVTVDADLHRLQQVAANLVGNALKFSERGGEVTVSVTTVDGSAELVVRDTGAGIAPEFLPYIFDRFRQADTSLTRPYPGLGLGLWVVKQIVDAHGGTVRADSDGPGTGATVTVNLPAS